MGDQEDPGKGDSEKKEDEEEAMDSLTGNGDIMDPNANLVSVESKTVDYVIMNPDFYKEPKKSIRITGPNSAYEYVTRKPRN